MPPCPDVMQALLVTPQGLCRENGESLGDGKSGVKLSTFSILSWSHKLSPLSHSSDHYILAFALMMSPTTLLRTINAFILKYDYIYLFVEDMHATVHETRSVDNSLQSVLSFCCESQGMNSDPTVTTAEPSPGPDAFLSAKTSSLSSSSCTSLQNSFIHSASHVLWNQQG